MSKPGDIWHRFEDKAYAPLLDEFERPMGPGRAEVRHLTYWVAKVTPKGVQLIWREGNGVTMPNFAEVLHLRPRFVADASTKRFACATIEEAEASFKARKARQIGIYQARIRGAEEALQALEWRLHGSLSFYKNGAAS